MSKRLPVRRSFTGGRVRHGPGRITPRVREVIELSVFGIDGKPPMSRNEIAAHLGVTPDWVYRMQSSPAARALWNDLRREAREAEFARNTHALVEVRDDPAMKASAAGARARIEAVRTLEGGHHDVQRHGAPGQTLTPGVVVTVNVNRGPADVSDEIILVSGAVQDADGGASEQAS